MMIDTLIFDLDDTLLECSAAYLHAKQTFIEHEHLRTGIDPHIIKNILHGIDTSCMEMEDGFKKTRLPRSFCATSHVLDIMIHGTPTHSYDVQYKMGQSVFDAEYPLYPGVDDMLGMYQTAGFNMILYTKGDVGVQHNKLEKNKLFKYFHPSDVHVVLQKNVFALKRMIELNGITIRNCAVIGDSIKDDIIPAERLGIMAIHADTHGNKSFWHDSNYGKPQYQIPMVTDLPLLIPCATIY